MPTTIRPHAASTIAMIMSACLAVPAASEAGGFLERLRPKGAQHDMLVVVLDASPSNTQQRAAAGALRKRRCDELQRTLEDFVSGGGRRTRVRAVIVQTGGSTTGGNPLVLWGGQLNPRPRGLATDKRVARAKARALNDAVGACRAKFKVMDATPLYAALSAAAQTLAARCPARRCRRRQIKVHSDGFETIEPAITARLKPKPKHRRRRRRKHRRRITVPTVAMGPGIRVRFCGLSETHTAPVPTREAVWRQVMPGLGARLVFDPFCRR